MEYTKHQKCVGMEKNMKCWIIVVEKPGKHDKSMAIVMVRLWGGMVVGLGGEVDEVATV